MIKLTLNQMRDLNKGLQATSWKNYTRMLHQLCKDYNSFQWVSGISDALRRRDIPLLVERAGSLAAQQYADATEHFVANQFAAIILKYPFPNVEKLFDAEGEAIRKFQLAERSCARVNRRFRARRARVNKPLPFWTQIETMRRFIQYVIGYAPPMVDIYDNCGFGPGAAVGVSGNATHVGAKLSAADMSVTPSALYYAYSAIQRNHHFRENIFRGHMGFSSGSAARDAHAFASKVRFVRHNKITFVPKTVKVHRTIAVEPLLNGFLQKGVDVVMRARLLRIGIDLSDQEPNKEGARQGSLPNQLDPLCTIDLSSASDSISIELVREVLPPDWFDLLNALRSKEFLLKDKLYVYEKFCSMGNGFCFPLETLLFTAACHAVGAGQPGKDFQVYGDDIVVRQSVSDSLIALLRYLGFRTNTAKTFLSGPFRESCGADWFGGEDVRPFILDYALDSVENVFKFANLTQRSNRCSGFFDGVRGRIIDLLPVQWRFYRPYPGPANTAITALGGEFLSSPTCTYSIRTRAWKWLELLPRAVNDNVFGHSGDSAYALMYAALSGSQSRSPFTLRNIAKTKVRVISHCGATSLWLPPHPR